MGRDFSFAACVFLLFTLVSCSFDYGPISLDDEDQPNVVMNDVEYVRVKDGSPLVRFEAEGAERYEKRQTMELKNFSFEQFNTAADDINAVGHARNASVQLESGNISMKNGVRIQVDSEDIAIETQNLEWQDKTRQLSAGLGEPVAIRRLNGTSFTGWGFSADVRRRTWTFTDGVQGVYIETDDDETGEPGDVMVMEDDGARLPTAPEDTGEFEAFKDTVK
ncbi:MAG: LPS export ABC transporter periplasmic protein LptC [Treponema sp.]|jgi:LPS export ABC transporter protein LptC|nr:LPS export ABC transporter periplasmic protein LptC [Treponema sp.]